MIKKKSAAATNAGGGRSEVVIEKNIPIPKGGSRSKVFSTAMKAMEVGDSFLITHRERNRVGTLAAYHGFKIKTRTENNDDVRVWLTEKKIVKSSNEM